ncbi:MAG: DUF4233 domain-containing protein [Gulosibacter sp.]|uniref:DUF4233 domain-containing protein n=1 Tax=Gulosibacter sp. TaxID=2817531 RepID=UPI003F917A79
MIEQLGSILIAFELAMVMLTGMALFGLKAVSPAIAFGGMGVFLVLFVLGVFFLRKPWGAWYVLGLQIALTLVGFVHPAVFFVGGLFLAVWIYCMYQGLRIDAERAVIIAEYEREQAAQSGRESTTE